MYLLCLFLDLLNSWYSCIFLNIDIKSDVWHSANCCSYCLKLLRINHYYYFADICEAASTWSRFILLSSFVKGTLQYSYLSFVRCCRCGLFYSFCLCNCTSVSRTLPIILNQTGSVSSQFFMWTTNNMRCLVLLLCRVLCIDLFSKFCC